MTEEKHAEEKQIWVILEAMGHQRAAGRYYFENGLHRIDIPNTAPNAPDRFIRTELYGPPAIFRITHVSEEAARLVAKGNIIPEAVPWDARQELRQLAAPQGTIENAEYPPDDDPYGFAEDIEE